MSNTIYTLEFSGLYHKLVSISRTLNYSVGNLKEFVSKLGRIDKMNRVVIVFFDTVVCTNL